MLSEPCNE